MYTCILVPVDGSGFSERAVEEADSLAHALGSKLVLFHAVPQQLPPPVEGLSTATAAQAEKTARTKMEAEAQTVLIAAERRARFADGKVERHFAVSNCPYDAILAAAKTFRCDLIVMASHGRRGANAVLLGSETQKVLAHSKVPVLVVK